jgi:nitrite reductase/ring-hydroxylating ferredoxin subunit
MPSEADNTASQSIDQPRRSFLGRVLAIIAGGIAMFFPIAAGLGVLLDPLRRKRSDATNGPPGDAEMAGYTRICPLDALPANGLPQQFVVTADTTDAWTRTTGQRVGMVFLVREDAGDKPQISAFTAACPHLGCAVEFDAGDDQFECPCHVSGFGKDGRKLFGPSLRGLDALDIKLMDRNGLQEVWVAFKQFRAGVAERIPAG